MSETKMFSKADLTAALLAEYTEEGSAPAFDFDLVEDVAGPPVVIPDIVGQNRWIETQVVFHQKVGETWRFTALRQEAQQTDQAHDPFPFTQGDMVVAERVYGRVRISYETDSVSVVDDETGRLVGTLNETVAIGERLWFRNVQYKVLSANRGLNHHTTVQVERVLKVLSE